LTREHNTDIYKAHKSSASEFITSCSGKLTVNSCAKACEREMHIEITLLKGEVDKEIGL